MYAIEPNVDAIRLDHLQARNFYQRLGFNDIGPTPDQIEKACLARRRMLKDSFDDFDVDEWNAARNLVEEAYDCLIQPHRRRRYDARLQRKHKGIPKVKNLVLSRYQLGEKISDGERTSIYEAYDVHLSRDVIIKKLASKFVRSAEHQAVLRREAELFAGHNSGHLVKILDFDAPKGVIVLEKMAGDMSSLSKPCGLEPQFVYDLLEQSLLGLEVLHGQGLAHGRVDYQHLLLDDRDRIKLSVTPGISGTAVALSPSHATNHVAPEMLNPGVFGVPGVATDLYALGFLMLELLVGKGFAKMVNPGCASKGEGSHGWLLWHASPTDHLPPVLELCPRIDPAFANVLERMIVKDQNKRLSSSSECLEALLRTRKPVLETSLPTRDQQSEVSDVQHVGSPEAMTSTFQIEKGLTWRDVLKQPHTLLRSEGRQYAAMLFIGLLTVCSLTLILFSDPVAEQPKTIPIKTASVSREKENELPWYPEPSDDSTDAKPEPSVVVNQPVATQTTGPISPPRADQVSPHPTPPTADQNRLIAEIVKPSEFFDPELLDLASFSMPIVGVKNTDQALMQTRLLRRVFEVLCQSPAKIRNAAPPYKLPSRPVDPRFSFSLGLLHYQQGDKETAETYCQRSLADAEHFGIAFMPSLQLRSQISMSRGKCMIALADCRSVLSALRGSRTRMSAQEKEAALSELAWWTGTLVGVIENTDIDNGSFKADTGYTSRYFRQDCAPEVWGWFEAGRRKSAERASELTLAWQDHQAKLQDAQRQNQIHRFKRHRYRNDKQAESRMAELLERRMRLQLNDPFSDAEGFGPYRSEQVAAVEPEDILVKETPKFLGNSPHRFSSYVPDDTTVIARRAYESIASPSRGQLVATH